MALTIHGGNGSQGFNIQPLYGEGVFQLRGWGGKYVDALQIVYQNPAGGLRVSAKVGGGGGSESDANYSPLGTRTWIGQVGGRAGAYNDRICVYGYPSSPPAASKCWGGTGGSDWGLEPTGVFAQSHEIAGMAGSYGVYLDRIQFFTYNK
jgi:hypothetical protein